MAVKYNNRLRGKTVMFCQLAAPTVRWLLWGNAETKSKSSTFPWAGGGAVHKGEINYAHQSFVTTPQSGK